VYNAMQVVAVTESAAEAGIGSVCGSQQHLSLLSKDVANLYQSHQKLLTNKYYKIILQEIGNKH